MRTHRVRSVPRVIAQGLLAIALLVPGLVVHASQPVRVSLDYAYYNPVGLLLKEKGWLEEDLGADGIEVRWTLSLGSNRSLEFLRGGAIDFGSTAGSAALVARAGGLPIKAVYVYSKPEWTALVTRADSPIRTVADLKGRSVAVTRGTDPHIFLLRALAEAGLSDRDIDTVLLQHPDGYAALLRGQVDAWAGLDPHMARAEFESGALLFHRDVDLNTYGVLNVREAFARQHPGLVRRVLAAYERARAYALANPQEYRDVLVRYAQIAPEVAERQLQRTDISRSAIGDEQRRLLQETGLVLKKIGILRANVDVDRVVADLIDDSFNDNRR